MKRIELLYTYLLNRYEFLEQELIQLRSNFLYRKNVDSLDCLELIIALERLQMHKEIMHHIFHIMNMRQFDEKYGMCYNYDDELEEQIKCALRQGQNRNTNAGKRKAPKK